MKCPICEEESGCEKNISSTCWCEQITFPTSVIEQIPANQQGTACVCLKCVKKSKNSSK